jgi:PAS domain S-box-containing protein
MARLKGLSLHHKILLGAVAIVLFLAVAFDLVAIDRIIMPKLEEEIIRRCHTIARAVSIQAGGLVVTHNRPRLLSLLFEKRRLEPSVAYLIVTDPSGQVLADTFVAAPPPELLAIHPKPRPDGSDERLVTIGDAAYYETAHAIMEGIYPVGVVRVGMSKALVDDVISRLHLALVGVMAVMVVVAIWVASRLSRQLTRPVAELTRAAEEIGRGNLDVRLGEEADSGPEAAAVPLGVAGGARVRDELEQLTATFAQMVRQLKHSRDELRQAYDFRDNLLRSSPDAVVASDEAGRIVLFNEAAEALFGYRAGEVVGHLSILDLFPEAAGGRMEQALFAAGRLADFETRVRHRSGRLVEVAVSASALVDEGRRVGAVGFLRDLTEHKRMEEEMQRADRLATVGRAVAYITHEIKNPLMVIGGLANQVVARPEPGDKEREKLAIIVKEIKRLEAILLEIGEFTKAAHLERSAVSLPALLKEVLQLMEAAFEKRHIEVAAELPEGLPAASGDPLKLKQVFINLIKNATDAMPGGGRLRVGAALRDGHLEVRIADSGQGIPAEVMRELFKPFFTTKAKGTGLGLTISRQIIEAHQGELKLTSEPGQGTECVVSLPAAEEPPAPPA